MKFSKKNCSILKIYKSFWLWNKFDRFDFCSWTSNASMPCWIVHILRGSMFSSVLGPSNVLCPQMTHASMLCSMLDSPCSAGSNVLYVEVKSSVLGGAGWRGVEPVYCPLLHLFRPLTIALLYCFVCSNTQLLVLQPLVFCVVLLSCVLFKYNYIILWTASCLSFYTLLARQGALEELRLAFSVGSVRSVHLVLAFMCIAVLPQSVIFFSPVFPLFLVTFWGSWGPLQIPTFARLLVRNRVSLKGKKKIQPGDFNN